jgi:hypothetical protein
VALAREAGAEAIDEVDAAASLPAQKNQNSTAWSLRLAGDRDLLDHAGLKPRAISPREACELLGLV